MRVINTVTSKGKYRARRRVPDITPVELRKELWGKFGKRRVFVRRKQFTNLIYVYCPDKTIVNAVANICCKYEDLNGHPEAVSICILQRDPPVLAKNEAQM